MISRSKISFLGRAAGCGILANTPRSHASCYAKTRQTRSRRASLVQVHKTDIKLCAPDRQKAKTYPALLLADARAQHRRVSRAPAAECMDNTMSLQILFHAMPKVAYPLFAMFCFSSYCLCLIYKKTSGPGGYRAVGQTSFRFSDYFPS